MRNFMLFVALFLSALVILPNGRASEFDKKTILTFPQPVQVPGAILDSGTYVIRRTNPGGNPDVVSFFNRDETHVYATAKAIPTERPNPAEKPQVTFTETASGSPEALKKWYYPGDLTGEEFVYPKGQLTMMANNRELQTSRSTVSDSGAAAPAPTEEMTPNTEEKQGTVENNQPVETAQTRNPAPEPPATSESQTTQSQTETQTTPATQPNAPERLPATASNIPLLCLIGAAAFSFGLGLKKLCKASS